jgi:hypothetical protein
MKSAGKKGATDVEDGIAVFIVGDASKCDECGSDFVDGDFLKTEGANGLCLDCADLGHLVYLARGDMALTRRSKKYSTLSAVVLKWSRRRKQYERQGILVEEAALERAEVECVIDADVRAVRQVREAERRAVRDMEYIGEFETKIRELYPSCPADAARQIAEHACEKYSGRVGRSARAKEFDPKAVRLAVGAHVRHKFTAYDELLARGCARQEARDTVVDKMDRVLRSWQRANAKPI